MFMALGVAREEESGSTDGLSRDTLSEEKEFLD